MRLDQLIGIAAARRLPEVNKATQKSVTESDFFTIILSTHFSP